MNKKELEEAMREEMRARKYRYYRNMKRKERLEHVGLAFCFGLIIFIGIIFMAIT